MGSCVSKDYTLHTRSLRNTAGRRAAQCEEMRRVEAGKKMLADMAETTRRCDRGRLPSDSSSGISDDASSSGSGSDRDSGIETGDIGAVGSWGHCVTGAGVPVSYGLDQETDRMMATADREKIREVLETGVRRMKLETQRNDKKCQGMSILSIQLFYYDIKSNDYFLLVQEISPRKTRSSWSQMSSETPEQAGSPESPVRVKLLFRKKRSPILDDVLSEGRASSDPPIVRYYHQRFETDM